MRHYAERTIPARVEKFCVKTTCDLCGNNVSNCGFGDVEINVEHVERWGGFEGGISEKQFVDMCSQCFEEKLVPWLQSQGAQLQTEETNW